MARLILLFSLLPAIAYTLDTQSTLPRDPLCACTVNVPERGCGNSCGCGADENVVKKSEFLALQAQMQELRQELAMKRTAHMKQCSRRSLADGRENGVLM
ncbi:hypothetical protein LSAT2_025133, partial [Lamellibrachia satsuma]